MGYQVQEFDIKIGDTGVTQTDNSEEESGEIGISVDVNLVPSFGGTIINVLTVYLGESGAPAPFFATPNSDNSWNFTASYLLEEQTYPLATGTIVASLTAIVAH